MRDVVLFALGNEGGRACALMGLPSLCREAGPVHKPNAWRNTGQGWEGGASRGISMDAHAVRRQQGGACGGRQIMCTHEAALTLHENRPGSQTGAWKGARLGRRGRREADRWTRMRCVGSSGVRRRVENWRGAHPRGLNGRRSGVRRRRPFWRVLWRRTMQAMGLALCRNMHSYVHTQKCRGRPSAFLYIHVKCIFVSVVRGMECGGGAARA